MNSNSSNFFYSFLYTILIFSLTLCALPSISNANTTTPERVLFKISAKENLDGRGFESTVDFPPITSPTCLSANSGDLSKHMTNELDRKIALVTDATSARQLWLNRPLTLDGLFVRNPNVWTTSLNLSGVSPINVHPIYPGYANQKAGTLISPRHVVFATHHNVVTSAKMIFIASDGAKHERTLMGKKDIAGTDITIGVLNADLPNTIATYEVLGYDSYMKKERLVDGRNVEVLMISLNQHGQVLLHALTDTFDMGTSKDGTTGAGFSHTHFRTYPVAPHIIGNAVSTPMRIALSGANLNGDSGYPNFVVINGLPVLLGVHKNSAYGHMLGAYTVAINAAMKELGGDYKLRVVDLKCFADYR
jgi:hypothetical protein